MPIKAIATLPDNPLWSAGLSSSWIAYSLAIIFAIFGVTGWLKGIKTSAQKICLIIFTTKATTFTIIGFAISHQGSQTARSLGIISCFGAYTAVIVLVGSLIHSRNVIGVIYCTAITLFIMALGVQQGVWVTPLLFKDTDLNNEATQNISNTLYWIGFMLLVVYVAGSAHSRLQRSNQNPNLSA